MKPSKGVAFDMKISRCDCMLLHTRVKVGVVFSFISTKGNCRLYWLSSLIDDALIPLKQILHLLCL